MAKHCKACGKPFKPHSKVPDQLFCSSPECQRERRRRWQQQKRRDDPAYRDNDARQLKDWSTGNPSYWKQYRQTNSVYAERNRNQQQTRNQRQRTTTALSGYKLSPEVLLPSGRYLLAPVCVDGIANEDALIVEITVISGAPPLKTSDCK